MTVRTTRAAWVLRVILSYGCAADKDVAGGATPFSAAGAVAAGANLDVLARLQMLSGISNVKEVTEPSDQNSSTETTNSVVTRVFEFEIKQPIDHLHPELGTFQMRAGLHHADWAGPMTFGTSGYWLAGATASFAWNVPGNTLTLEHRFFGASTPGIDSGIEPPDEFWQYLTARQAAADYHHLIETFKALYTGPWLTTGHSKGSLAALFHRRFYPDDVAGTVVLGAPAARGTDDPRFEEFLEQVGDAQCRAGIVALQREALSRRAELLQAFTREAENRGLTFELLGIEVAFEHFVEDYRFKYWQTPRPPTGCPPASEPGSMSAEAILSAIDTFSFISFGADQRLRGRDGYEAYYFQAATELGDHGPLERHLEDLISFPGSYSAHAYAPKIAGSFDPKVMDDLERWVLSESERIIFVYGEDDPWRAAAFAVPAARDVVSFNVPGETHGVSLEYETLPAADRERASQLLQAWTGFTPKLGP
jgi:pimeloyl-ACP methyl ester carboxylesterase